MRNLGHLLMWGGFLITSFVTMREASQVSWGPYFATAVIGIAGVLILRRTESGPGGSHEAAEANVRSLQGSMDTLVKNLQSLHDHRESTFVYDIHGQIDDTLAPELAAFADARESMIPRFGLAGYAEVMDRFARAERLINRAWSASADGYIDEVWKSLGHAQDEMREAQSHLQRHAAS